MFSLRGLLIDGTRLEYLRVTWPLRRPVWRFAPSMRIALGLCRLSAFFEAKNAGWDLVDYMWYCII